MVGFCGYGDGEVLLAAAWRCEPTTDLAGRPQKRLDASSDSSRGCGTRLLLSEHRDEALQELRACARNAECLLDLSQARGTRRGVGLGSFLTPVMRLLGAEQFKVSSELTWSRRPGAPTIDAGFSERD